MDLFHRVTLHNINLSVSPGDIILPKAIAAAYVNFIE